MGAQKKERTFSSIKEKFCTLCFFVCLFIWKHSSLKSTSESMLQYRIHAGFTVWF